MGHKKSNKTLDRATEVTGDSAKGTKIGTRNYEIRIPKSGNNVVSVIDKTAGRIKQSTGKPAGDWLIRFDKPHRGARYEHININPELTGLPQDPHIKISPSTLKAAKGTAEALKKANKVLLPVAIVTDSVRLGANIVNDIKNDTSRNTVKTATSVAGGWGGGYAGASTGAAIGSAIFPGFGTIIGGIVGGIAGGIGGAVACEKTVDAIGDANDWDIEECVCQDCGRTYKRRKYLNESKYYCPSCR